MYILSLTIFSRKISTEIFTCHCINQQTSVVQKAGAQFYISDSTVYKLHYQPIDVRKCNMPPGKQTVCTENCALL